MSTFNSLLLSVLEATVDTIDCTSGVDEGLGVEPVDRAIGEHAVVALRRSIAKAPAQLHR